MLGEAELLRGLQKQNWTTPVHEVMRADLPTVGLDEPLYLALEKMARGRMRAAPVVDREGQLVGLLTTADVNEAYRLFSVGLNPAPVAR
jgi:CBS domain-containing protein